MSIKCEWINKMEYNDLVFIHKKELLIQPTKWRNSNTLIKRNQTLKTTYCVFPFISVPRKCKTIVVKSRSVTAGPRSSEVMELGERGGMTGRQSTAHSSLSWILKTSQFYCI